MFEAAVDGFGRTVAGVGMIEVSQDVSGSAFERSAQRDELGQAPRYARGGQCVDFGFHQGLTADFVGIAVGVDNTLVHAPGDFECDVAIGLFAFKGVGGVGIPRSGGGSVGGSFGG